MDFGMVLSAWQLGPATRHALYRPLMSRDISVYLYRSGNSYSRSPIRRRLPMRCPQSTDYSRRAAPMVGGASVQALSQPYQLVKRGSLLSGPVPTPHLPEPGRLSRVAVVATVALDKRYPDGNSFPTNNFSIEIGGAFKIRHIWRACSK